MADNTVTLSFNNDLFTDARGDTATYSGTLQVDYTTNSFSGNVKITGQTRGFGAGFDFSGGLSTNNNIYTVAGNNFTLSCAGQQLATAYAEFKLNNNQDFRTSLNPAGQKNQPVTSTGNGTTANAARAEAASVASPTDYDGSTQNVSALDASTACVFDPGHGHDVVSQFRALGAGHDTLGLSSADFGNSIAEVLRDTRNSAGGAVITDPATHDTVRLVGVTKARLVHDQGDVVLHG